jgi:hypothetical protein
LNSSPSIIRIIKSGRMRWAGHVALIGEKTNAHRALGGKPEETTGKTQDVDGWTILKWISRLTSKHGHALTATV